MKFKRFLITLCLTEHLQCLLMKVAGFQPTTLLKKKALSKMFFKEFCKLYKKIFSFDRTPRGACFLCLSVNFGKFFRRLLIESASAKLLFHEQVAEFHSPDTVKTISHVLFKHFIQKQDAAIQNSSFT